MPGFRPAREPAEYAKAHRDAIHAINQKDTDAFRDALSRIDLTDKGLIHKVAAHGSVEMAEMLLGEYTHPDFLVNHADANGIRPLHEAVRYRNNAMVEYLLAHGAEVNKVDSTKHGAIHVAAERGWYELIPVLHANGAKLDKRDTNGCTPIYHASLRGKSRATAALLKAGANPNIPTNNRETPLLASIRFNHRKSAGALLGHGANWRWLNETGNNALHVAVTYGKPVLAHVLLEGMKVNPNTRNRVGKAAIHIAGEMNDGEMMKMILRHGGDVDVRDAEGETALHKFARHGNNDAVRYLLSRNAGTRIKNKDGKTPEQVARTAKKSTIAEMIRSPD